MGRKQQPNSISLLKYFMGAMVIISIWAFLWVPWVFTKVSFWFFITMFFFFSFFWDIIATHKSNVRVGQTPTSFRISAKEIFWDSLYGFIFGISVWGSITLVYILIIG